jgi:hypothetical protein
MAQKRTSETPVIFRSPTWLLWFLSIASLTIGLGAGLLYLSGGASVYSIGLIGLSLLTIAGLADALTTRVELNDLGLTQVATFRRRFIPRGQIDSVTWEAGTGVAIRLTNGEWVRLPDIGNSQARASSIRAWLKRTPG